MKVRNILILTMCGMTSLLAGCGGSSDGVSREAGGPQPETQTQEAPAPTPDEQVAGLEAMCAEAQPALVARQAENALFNRVGGREGIHEMVAETVRRHQINETIKHTLDGVDPDLLIERVTDFLVLATGGQGEYHGRDMVAAHSHLNLSNADFLAAGSDLGAAMDVAGWGENEKQELLCAFVSLRSQVVTSES